MAPCSNPACLCLQFEIETCLCNGTRGNKNIYIPVTDFVILWSTDWDTVINEPSFHISFADQEPEGLI